MCLASPVDDLPVEYAGRRIEYGILFILSLCYTCSNVEYVHIHVIYRVHQAEYGIPVFVVAPQEYVNRTTGHTHTTAEHTTVEETTHTDTERATTQRRLLVEVVVAALNMVVVRISIQYVG